MKNNSSREFYETILINSDLSTDEKDSHIRDCEERLYSGEPLDELISYALMVVGREE